MINLQQLEERRRELGMTQRSLAKRSGLSTQTVKRTLAGESEKLSVIVKLADAMGMKFELKPSVSAARLMQQQAQQKARWIVRLAQGTSALESQAVSNSVIEEAEVQAAAELLAGSKRKLWE